MTAAPAATERLADAPLTVLGVFADASNATLLVHLDDHATPPDPESITQRDLADLDPGELAVYKPVSGQRPLWDFDAATLPRREVAAFEVDRSLGTDLVPATVWRDTAPHGPGSLQAYVGHDVGAHLLTWVETSARDDEALAGLVVFDLVANNTDRKSGHVLVDGDAGRIWAIDHGVTFHREDKLRTVAWQLQGEPIPPQLRAACAGLAETLARDASWLRAHLADDEVIATIRRARVVADLQRFPLLADRSQLPWPLV